VPKRFGRSDDVALAGATEGLFFDVDFPNCWGEVHHAAFVVTVFESQCVADLVDDFLADAVREDVRGRAIRKAAVRRRPEAIRRDDAAVAPEVGESEDVVAPVVKQVLGGERDVFLPRTHPFGEVDELLGPVLVPVGVVRAAGDRLGVVDGHVAVVDSSETAGGLPLDDRVDLADRHDVDVHGNAYGFCCHKNPDVQDVTMTALVERLRTFDSLVEVGVGRRPELAGSLADAGVAVTATDVRYREVPDAVDFQRDDVTDPDLAVYEGADAIYAVNLPEELQRPTRDVARAVDAAFLFTTLGAEHPAISAAPETLPGETLYRAEPERA